MVTYHLFIINLHASIFYVLKYDYYYYLLLLYKIKIYFTFEKITSMIN